MFFTGKDTCFGPVSGEKKWGKSVSGLTCAHDLCEMKGDPVTCDFYPCRIETALKRDLVKPAVLDVLLHALRNDESRVKLAILR